MPNFFKNFHNFYKEFGSYISIFVVVVICLVIYVLKSWQKKADKERDKEREEEERQKLTLSNLEELVNKVSELGNKTSEIRNNYKEILNNYKEILNVCYQEIYSLRNKIKNYYQMCTEIIAGLEEICLHNILKNNSQIEILANGIFDKNNLSFTYNKPLEFSLPNDELSFAQNFDALVPENVKKINIKFNVVEINVVEKFKKISNIPVEFEVFIREGNQDKKLNNRDKEYEFDYRQGEKLRFYFGNLEKKLGCYYECYFAIQSIAFRDPLKSS